MLSLNRNLSKIIIKNRNLPILRQLSCDNSNKYDIVVVGGGIVGTATAVELSKRHCNYKIAIVEKEDCLAKHQSGHNSGVIHAGIYYKPGSLKAKLCVEGLHLAYRYLSEKNIPYKKCGKLIVATNLDQVCQLETLYERSLQNNVPDVKFLHNCKEIREIEPNCMGIKAIWSPQTGIVDWSLVTKYLGKDFENNGGQIHYSFEVRKFHNSFDAHYPVAISSSNRKTIHAKYVLTCAGLQSDYVAILSGCSKEPRIVPFRGEYLLLSSEKSKLINGNIYPVPDPRFPFLGVHFTPRMDGSVWLGPNAILALRREGYGWFDISIKELLDVLFYAGFRKLSWKYLSYGMQEMMKSINPKLQVKELQKFIPEITVKDVTRGPTGVRAQALDINGDLVDDFCFDMGKGDIGKRILHCRNAPSPGATSSLAIAKMIADKMREQFNLDK